MLTQREMVDHAALCNERCNCLTWLAVIVAVVFALTALAWCWPAAWEIVGWFIVGDLLWAAQVTWRLMRVSRRLRTLEEFL